MQGSFCTVILSNIDSGNLAYTGIPAVILLVMNVAVVHLLGHVILPPLLFILFLYIFRCVIWFPLLVDRTTFVSAVSVRHHYFLGCFPEIFR